MVWCGYIMSRHFTTQQTTNTTSWVLNFILRMDLNFFRTRYETTRFLLHVDVSRSDQFHLHWLAGLATLSTNSICVDSPRKTDYKSRLSILKLLSSVMALNFRGTQCGTSSLPTCKLSAVPVHLLIYWRVWQPWQQTASHSVAHHAPSCANTVYFRPVHSPTLNAYTHLLL